MKRFMLGMTLAVALGVTVQTHAMDSLAAVTKRIGDAAPKVPVVFNQTKEAVLDVKNMVQRLKDMPELVKAGMPIDQFVRVLGGNLSDLENGLVKRLQQVVNISLVDFVGIFSDKSVQLGGQWNDMLMQARGAMQTLSDILVSTRLPQGTQASMQSFSQMPIIENTQDLASATAKQPSTLARLKMIPAAAKKLPVVIDTVQNTINGVKVVVSNVQALSRNLPSLSEVQRVNEVGRLMAQLQSALLNNAGVVVSIAITDFGGIFSDDVALAGRKFTAVMGNFNNMINAIALMLQSVRAPGAAAPTTQVPPSTTSMQQPAQQPMRQPMPQTAPPSSYPQSQYYQPPVANTVPRPGEVAPSAPPAPVQQYDASRGYEQFRVPQQR